MASASSKISTGITLTSDFFLKNFYKYNRNVIKSSARSSYSKTELSYEDSRALKRAVAKLASFDYSETENEDNIESTIKAFVKTYNYTIESTSSKDSDTYRQNRQLKALSQKYSKELKNLGITVEENGTLSVSDNILKNSSMKEIRKVFSEESDYVQKVRNIARRMNNSSYEEVYAYMTGTGGRINVVL